VLGESTQSSRRSRTTPTVRRSRRRSRGQWHSIREAQPSEPPPVRGLAQERGAEVRVVRTRCAHGVEASIAQVRRWWSSAARRWSRAPRRALLSRRLIGRIQRLVAFAQRSRGRAAPYLARDATPRLLEAQLRDMARDVVTTIAAFVSTGAAGGDLRGMVEASSSRPRRQRGAHERSCPTCSTSARRSSPGVPSSRSPASRDGRDVAELAAGRAHVARRDARGRGPVDAPGERRALCAADGRPFASSWCCTT